MARLELEITDKLMEKLEERAETYAVEPSDVAKSIISCELARSGKPSWLDKANTLVSNLTQLVIAGSKMEAPKSEQQ